MALHLHRSMWRRFHEDVHVVLVGSGETIYMYAICFFSVI
jgi:hypothetical protein